MADKIYELAKLIPNNVIKNNNFNFAVLITT